MRQHPGPMRTMRDGAASKGINTRHLLTITVHIRRCHSAFGTLQNLWPAVSDRVCWNVGHFERATDNRSVSKDATVFPSTTRLRMQQAARVLTELQTTCGTSHKLQDMRLQYGRQTAIHSMQCRGVIQLTQRQSLWAC